MWSPIPPIGIAFLLYHFYIHLLIYFTWASLKAFVCALALLGSMAFTVAPTQSAGKVANKLDRFAIGDRDELKYNAAGSLDIFIQHESPGKDKESNWLPSPDKGVLSVTMRLYAPKAQVVDGRWAPPVVKRVE